MHPENLNSKITPNNGNCQRNAKQRKSLTYQKHYGCPHSKIPGMHIRPNITKAHWDHWKNSTTRVHQITSGERFSKCYWEGSEVYKKRARSNQ